MEQNNFHRNKIGNIILVLSGNLLFALTVKLFLLPANLVAGGTTGIALVINHWLGISVSVFVFIFNVVMLILGYCCLGKKFALTTILSTFAYPLALEFFDIILGDLVLSEDIFLCTLFSGIGIGVALGIVIRAGASTGGMDIPPLVLKKYCRIPVSVSLYLFDICILLFQIPYHKIDTVLYGVMYIILYTMVLDKVLMIGSDKIEIKIITDQTEEVRNAILAQADRGVTILYGEGGYSRQQGKMILSVVTPRELPFVQKLVSSIDPECFMVVSKATSVSGRGFTLSKHHPRNKNTV